MRLRSVFISEYKNLKNFKIDLDDKSDIDIFVGKNGSGKSNLLEAIVEIFNFLYEYKEGKSFIEYDFKIGMELNKAEYEIECKTGKLKINGSDVKSVDDKYLPSKVILYYSGHNGNVAKIVESYEESFKTKIKSAGLDDSRSIISIGNEHKEILLSILLLLPDSSVVKNYIVEKLGIKDVAPWFRLILKKPYFAKKNIEIDEGEERFWGAKGIVRDFINRLLKCKFVDKSGRAKDEGYSLINERYNLFFDVKIFQDEFKDYNSIDFFHQLDNLKTLGMLAEVTVPVVLDKGVEANISYFSDGQFQSVYMYAIAEIFKEKECLTLLDEPDAFLHPEWQFTFLEQIKDISHYKGSSNHLIMSSHSASTISRADEKSIQLFTFGESGVEASKVSKSYVIDDLSKGLLTYSEDENLLRIDNVVRLSNKPVLFVEGLSDVSILETAYQKLYNTGDIPFLIQDMFDSGSIKVLLKRRELCTKYPDKPFIGLFDFDTQGYGDWSEFTTDWSDSETEMKIGLAKKHQQNKCYVFLLPVPEGSLKSQVWNDKNPINKILPNPHFCIEHLFWAVAEAKPYFKEKNGRIIFNADKINFAKNIVPTFQVTSFEILKPFFDTINAIR